MPWVKCMDKYMILKQYFGFQEFKYPQDKIIDEILDGKEVIGLLPTGFGKSLIYQVLAIMGKGVSIIISPLISLMEDQLLSLKKRKIPAAVLNSNQSYEEQEKIYRELITRKYKLLYISPERLRNDRFLACIEKCEVSMLVVDEAHTILWADSFREAFQDIGKFLSLLPIRPNVLALTATATHSTLSKIEEYLHLVNPKVIEAPIDRKNLIYRVYEVKHKRSFLINIIQKYLDKKGIIYCLTRKRVEELYSFLKEEGIHCTYYHGGLDAKVKKQNQTLFTDGDVNWLVCTNAFGMGIDIPNIRIVLAFEMPQSLEDLVQQMGRAARDGGYGEGIVLFSFSDIKTIDYFISQQKDSRVRKTNQRKKDKLIDYCLTKQCRHSFIGAYFHQSIPLCKNKCDNCLKKSR